MIYLVSCAVVAFIFLATAILNFFHGAYKDGFVCLVITAVAVLLFIVRKRTEVQDMATLSAMNLPCCKCGNKNQVKMRAYTVCVSVILFTFRSSGKFKPICDSCKARAGLLHSVGSALFGWWGIPWGPIHTVQSIIENIRGGVVLEEEKQALANQPSEATR